MNFDIEVGTLWVFKKDPWGLFVVILVPVVDGVFLDNTIVAVRLDFECGWRGNVWDFVENFCPCIKNDS